MKRTACLYTINNGVGLTADVSLIQDLLIDEYDIDVVYTQHDIADPDQDSITLAQRHGAFANYDVGIFIQEYDIQWLDRNKVNILIANEEWLQSEKLLLLKQFDKIITKSLFAKVLLSPYNNNIINCGFISRDRYVPNIKKQEKFLHVMGKSAQKGSEHVLTSFTSTCSQLPLTVIESRDGCTFKNLGANLNFNYIKEYISEADLNFNCNSHTTHLCPSYNEGWGHYLYEGLSCGALLYVTKLPMFLEWLDPDLVVFLDCTFQRCSEDIFFLNFRNNQYPHQFGWQVSQEDLDSKILNHKHYLENHKPDLARQFFKHLIDQNSKKLFKELTDV